MIQILFQIIRHQSIAAFHRTPARPRDQRRDMAVAFAIGGEQNELGAILDAHFSADDELQPMRLGCDMRTHHARERTFIGDRQCVVAQRSGAHNQFLRVRSATQKGEVGEAMQLAVSRKGGEDEHGNKGIIKIQ